MNRLNKILKKYNKVMFLLFVSCAVIFFSDPSLQAMQETSTINHTINHAEKNPEKNVDNKTEKNTENNPEKIAENNPVKSSKITVVVDAGHGGRDPGKVGVNGILEKDINLSIALKLKTLLEENDFHVIMTREEDIGLEEEGASSKKVSDMRKRVEIINNSDALVAISIHQNSFSQEDCKGAQVFYYSTSETGKEFANIMQNQLKKSIKDGNKRKAKSNNNYYMLKNTKCPIIIVECGYLSNNQECALLGDENYQEKMAWSIHLGLITYINQLLGK